MNQTDKIKERQQFPWVADENEVHVADFSVKITGVVPAGADGDVDHDYWTRLDDLKLDIAEAVKQLAHNAGFDTFHDLWFE